MAQVAYHVQEAWLWVTVVTPDRLENTRPDTGTMFRTCILTSAYPAPSIVREMSGTHDAFNQRYCSERDIHRQGGDLDNRFESEKGSTHARQLHQPTVTRSEVSIT